MNRNLAIRTCVLAALVAVTLGGAHSASARGIQMYFSAPDEITSPFSNTTVNTWNSVSAGTYTSSVTTNIGTYQASSTAKMAVIADNQYGAGSGNYMSIGAQSGTSAPLTLNLNQQVSYFGFAWNAGDANNGITLWKGNTQIAHLTTATITSMLSQSTVTAIDGTVYQSSKYFGKPNTTNTNTGEPYAFIHLIDTDGVFDKVVFDNSGTTGTGFETDNHTIRTSAPTPLGSFVSVGAVPSPVPEAGTMALIGTGLVGMIGIVRRDNNVVYSRFSWNRSKEGVHTISCEHPLFHILHSERSILDRAIYDMGKYTDA